MQRPGISDCVVSSNIQPPPPPTPTPNEEHFGLDPAAPWNPRMENFHSRRSLSPPHPPSSLPPGISVIFQLG